MDKRYQMIGLIVSRSVTTLVTFQSKSDRRVMTSGNIQNANSWIQLYNKLEATWNGCFFGNPKVVSTISATRSDQEPNIYHGKSSNFLLLIYLLCGFTKNIAFNELGPNHMNKEIKSFLPFLGPIFFFWVAKLIILFWKLLQLEQKKKLLDFTNHAEE